MKIVLIIGIILLVIAGFLAGFYYSAYFSQEVALSPAGNYLWTKAICNSDNECIDVEIVCENGNPVSVKPVSGLIKHSPEWEDPRNLSESLC